ncbi:MAG: hypothetical protein EXR28_16125 [Betaproteobacteria bacterium]|nr:hypothetical protein [Betaproteobacteria bacterium]
MSFVQTPAVLMALDLRHAMSFIWQFPGLSFVILGAVFLALTGGEVLYAAMGHFGKLPIWDSCRGLWHRGCGHHAARYPAGRHRDLVLAQARQRALVGGSGRARMN